MESLMWTTEEQKTMLSTPVFEILEKKQVAEAGPSGRYYTIQGRRCVCVLAEYEGKFVMVRQYRHGSNTVTAEIPGGLVDEGESPEIAAARELEEESGFRAEKVILLGTMNPNPALFEKGSELNICLAVHPMPTGCMHPDDDEVLHAVLVPKEELFEKLGTGEYTHAFLGTALAFYLRYQQCEKSI